MGGPWLLAGGGGSRVLALALSGGFLTARQERRMEAGLVKTTTQKTRFRSVNDYKEFTYR